MSAHLLTDLVDEQPQVLLLAMNTPLRQWMKSLLEQQKLAVFSVDSHTALQQQLDISATSPYYKVVWLLSTETPSEIEDISNWLQTSQQPVVVITTLLTPIGDERPIYKDWTNQSVFEKQTLQKLQQTLPEATLIIGQDVLTSPREFTPLKTITHFLDEQSLTDPNILLTLQTAQSFFQASIPNLMSPAPHRVIVQGKKITSTEWVKKIQLEYQRTQGILPPIEVLPAQTKNMGGLPVVTNPQPEPLSTFVKDVTKVFLMPKFKIPSSAQTPGMPSPDKRTHSNSRSVPHTSQNLPELAFEDSPEPISQAPIRVVKPPVSSPMAHTTVLSESTHQAPKSGPEPGRTPTPPTPSAEPQQEIEDQVVQLFDKYRSEHKVKRVEKIVTTTQTSVRKQTRKRKLFWAGLAFVGCGVGVSLLALIFVISQWLLQHSVLAQVNQLQTPSLKPTPLVSALPALTKLVETENFAYGLVLDHSFFDSASQLVAFSQGVAQLNLELSQLQPLTATATSQFWGQRSGEAIESWDLALNKAKSAYDRVAQTQAALKALDASQMPTKQQEQLATYQQWLNTQKKALLPSQYLQPLLPALLGNNGKRVYAVVLQNNQELRPTGGFIQSVALVTVANGSVIDTKVQSVYDLDQQSYGVVTPPGEIIRFLGEKQWFLRDSNWNPDFPTAAQQIAWFLEKSPGGQHIDGIIAVNLLTVHDLLQVVGPIDLPEYNEVLTDKNISERMEFHSEIQLVPDAQHQDYSTLVLTKVLQKISSAPDDKVSGLLSVLQQNLEANQMFVSLTKPEENTSLGSLGWTGAMLHPGCPTQLAASPCFVDVVSQVEANVGVNKANIYISRQIQDQVSVTEQGYTHHRVMTFANSASSPAWPKGPYKNYLRLYVSPGAQLNGITINQVAVPNDSVLVRDENGRRMFGVLVEVPVGQTVTVDATYSVPHPTTGAFSYVYFEQRQSGIPDPGLKVSFSPAAGLKPVVIAPQAEVKGQVIQFVPSPLPNTFLGAQFN